MNVLANITYRSICVGLCCLSLCGVLACGGGGGGDDQGAAPTGGSSGLSSRLNVSKTLTTVNTVSARSLSASSTTSREGNSPRLQATQTNSATVQCDTSGTADVQIVITIPDERIAEGSEASEANPVPFEILAEANFNDCDGLNGPLVYDMSGELRGDGGVYTAIVNGALGAIGNNGEECSVSFTDFSLAAQTVRSTDTPSGTISGTIGARCGSDSFSCTLVGVDLNDDNAIQDSCSG